MGGANQLLRGGSNRQLFNSANVSNSKTAGAVSIRNLDNKHVSAEAYFGREAQVMLEDEMVRQFGKEKLDTIKRFAEQIITGRFLPIRDIKMDQQISNVKADIDVEA